MGSLPDPSLPGLSVTKKTHSRPGRGQELRPGCRPCCPNLRGLRAPRPGPSPGSRWSETNESARLPPVPAAERLCQQRAQQINPKPRQRHSPSRCVPPSSLLVLPISGFHLTTEARRWRGWLEGWAVLSWEHSAAGVGHGATPTRLQLTAADSTARGRPGWRPASLPPCEVRSPKEATSPKKWPSPGRRFRKLGAHLSPFRPAPEPTFDAGSSDCFFRPFTIL